MTSASVSESADTHGAASAPVWSLTAELGRATGTTELYRQGLRVCAACGHFAPPAVADTLPLAAALARPPGAANPFAHYHCAVCLYSAAPAVVGAGSLDGGRAPGGGFGLGTALDAAFNTVAAAHFTPETLARVAAAAAAPSPTSATAGGRAAEEEEEARREPGSSAAAGAGRRKRGRSAESPSGKDASRADKAGSAQVGSDGGGVTSSKKAKREQSEDTATATTAKDSAERSTRVKAEKRHDGGDDTSGGHDGAAAAQPLVGTREVDNRVVEEAHCPRCQRYTDCRTYARQIRSADEGQTVFFECTVCKETWQLNS